MHAWLKKSANKKIIILSENKLLACRPTKNNDVCFGTKQTRGGKINPWRYVRDLVQPEDFVVVKVDIDTPKIEAEL